MYPDEWVKDNWCIRHALIPEVRNGGYPSNEISEIHKFKAEIAPMAIDKTRREQFRAYYRPGIRLNDGRLIGATAVWLDLDVLKNNVQLAEVQNAIKNLSPSPSIVVWSGGGFHLYWLLSSFCGDISRLNRIVAGLAKQFPSKLQKIVDKQQVTSGVDGGLRVVGSKNWGHGLPVDVSIQSTLTNDRGEIVRYELGDFVGYMEGPAAPPRRGSTQTKIEASRASDVFLHYYPTLDSSISQHCVKCYFHEDNTPSLSINLDSGVWKCHSERHDGVSQGGAISFYALAEGISIRDAKKHLAKISPSADKESLKEQLKNILYERFLPLYREGEDRIIGTNRKTHELVPITLGTDTVFTNGLARALGGAPTHVVEDYISGEMMGLTSLISAFRDVCLDLFVELPKEKSFTIIGSGIHQIETEQGWKTFMVDGEKFYEANLDFRNPSEIWKEGTVEGPAYGRIIPKFGLNEWFPSWRDEWGDIPSPPDVFKECYTILEEAWQWSEDVDPYIVALFTLYSWYHGWFGRPLSMFVCGPSHSGKSAITEGWFAGSRYGSVGMLAGTLTFKSTSLAGFYQTAAYQSKLCVLDEVYDSRSPAAHQLIEALRNLDANDFAVIRGSTSGRSVRYPIKMPFVWSAIKGPELEQDLNRQIMIYMKKKPGQRDPWDKIMQERSLNDLEKLRAALPLFLLKHREAVFNAKERIIDKFLRSGKIPFRKGQMLMPLLQIAHVCGVDMYRLAERLTGRAQAEEQELVSEGIDRELVSYILDFKLPVFSDKMTTTLAEQISKRSDISDANLGIYYRSRKQEIYIQGPQLVNNMLVKVPTFRDINLRRLGSILKPQPYYKGSSSINLGGDFGVRRVHILDAVQTLDAMEIRLNARPEGMEYVE